ncbi:MAG: hypothetical protein ACI4PV_07600 [Butyricicoccus sp.]
MPENNNYRPEELLYRMGHSTRAMNAFFSLDEHEREAVLGSIAAEPDITQAEARMEREMAWLEAIGQDYDRPAR